MSLVFVLTNRY